jgi:hypothetical protein
MAYGRTPWSQHHGGSVGAGLGGRLRSSEGEFLKVGRQGDANRLNLSEGRVRRTTGAVPNVRFADHSETAQN